MTGKRHKHSSTVLAKRSRRTTPVEATGSEAIYEGVHIDALPEELLGSILSLLEPRERVGVEAVSRRWRNISRRYAWCEQTLLDETMAWNDEDGKAYQDVFSWSVKKEIVWQRVRCLLERCSPYLREVRMDADKYGHLDHTVIDDITAARDLTTLELYWLPLPVASAELIGERLPKLECLQLIWCFELFDLEPTEAERALTAILKGCRSLLELDISENGQSLTGETSFAHLPPSLRSLSISSCSRLHSSAIEHIRFACAHGHLRELDVSWLPIDGPVLAMGRLFEELPLLEKLVYCDGKTGGATPEEANAAMAKIGAMRRLKALDLSSNKLLTDEVLEVIADNCEELEQFSLRQWSKRVPVTPAGLRLLARLPKLSSLTFENNGKLDEEALLAAVAVGRLRKLALRGCQHITDSAVQRVLERCEGLRELDVGLCRRVTRATVKAIGDFVAGIASKGVEAQSTEMDERYFHLRCKHSSIKAQPGELQAELKAAHPAIKHVRQWDDKYGDETRPWSVHIWW